ncbi:hypothetical protein [Pseudodonghicola xiamenensis]|uniref:Uncharacterized protein n=1 Tax=Pseudodonghicola xiamenensis TaxID=337702 RepID=A0A8J3H8X3_9RHOB|nr:hypothetical protein [Pseudodonghicola xiamenensis]GHG95056.1 hypothetical protein GCM10010961_28470 [Pseudodonghicola xiamenensis]
MAEAICPAKRSFVLGAENVSTPHFVPEPALLAAWCERRVAAAGGIEHVLVGGKPGKRVAAGCDHIHSVNSLHARYGKFIGPFCGPAAKNLNGDIRWLDVRLSGMQPAEVLRAS